MKKVLLLLLIAIGVSFSCRKELSQVGLLDETLSSQSPKITAGMPQDLKSPEFAPNEIIVKFRNGIPDKALILMENASIKEKILTEAMKHANYTGIHVMYVPDVLKAVERFKRNPNVEWANPNYYVKHETYTPNDPYYTGGNLWGMGNIKSPTAWNSNIGDQQVYVGVVDEGIMYWHEDLCGQIWDNPYETENGKDDDGNGYIDDMHGWDFMHGDNTIFDNADNHGTHVSGTIGGIGNNGKGVIGVSPNVTIISGKFLEGSGSTSDAVKAIDYMTDLKTRHGMNIATTSNSWGGGGFDQALYDAINRARAQDILFTAAAGNNGMNTDVTPNYPSCYNLDNIISVAAYASNETLPSWTNYGLSTVDIGAPGVSINSSVPGTGGASTYASYSGTSMATPHVAGAVALYKAGHPTAKYTEIRNAILNSARPIAALNGKCVTGGALNVETFIQATSNQQTSRGCVIPPIDAVPPTAATNVQLVSKDSANHTATISWTPGTDNVGITKYLVTVDNTWYSASYSTSTNSITIGGLWAGAQYPARIVAYDAWNNSSPTTSYTIVLGYDTKPPTTPSNFTLVALDANSATFKYDWSTDDWSGVGMYRISYRVASCANCSWSGWHTNNVNPLAVPNLATNIQYAFTIAAMDNNRNWSPESAVILATPGNTLDLIPPTAPPGINATKTSNSIYPYWTAATDNVGVVAYDLYYKESTAANFVLYGSTPNTLLEITGLKSSTSYDMYVKAKDAAGNVSPASVTLTKTTDPGFDVNSPTPPSNLTATSTSTTITPSWTASTDNVGVSSYQVYYKPSSSATYLTGPSTVSTSTTITGLSSNTSYDIYVTARDAAGNTSLPSTTLTTSTQQSTTQYTIGVTLTGSIQQKTTHKLSWSSSVTPSGYTVKSVELQWLVNNVWTTLTTSTSLSGTYSQKVLDKNYRQYRVVVTLGSGQVGYSGMVALVSK